MGKPPISYRHKVCVICEGLEDTEYFNRLLQLNVWRTDVYDFYPINAKSASNIFARYQDAYNNDAYEVILVFCDTDKAPYREYSQIKNKINCFHAKSGANDKIIIFANPCTMQIVLSHFGDADLKNQGKKTNGKIIEELTGIAGYDAHADQVKELCSKIFKRSYPEMRERVKEMDNGDDVSGSTNFIHFLDKFENEDVSWIKDIKVYLEQ
jgi:hypothetical protein